jgi:serine/threonine-protein kinase
VTWLEKSRVGSVPWIVGRTLNNSYRILELVGTGGFADVYLGRDVRTNAVVAIKILHDQFTRDPAIVERFLREARLAQQLVDDHVVRILDSGDEGGIYYIVMEYVQGHTLAHLIQVKGPMPVPEAVEYVRQVLQALALAHRAGIVHRDIKPQNLMVTTSGLVKVMDFGIAKDLTTAGGTATTMYLGTPRYMSPEQAGGAPASPRSDLYAVAITLYELLRGQPPFTAETPWQIMNLQMTAEPPPITRFRADVPRSVVQVVNKGLQKDPNRRFQSAEEMLEALDHGVPEGDDTTASSTVVGGAERTMSSPPSQESVPRRREPAPRAMRPPPGLLRASLGLPRPAPLLAVAGALVVLALAGRFVLFAPARPAPVTWSVLVGDDGGPPASFDRPSALTIDHEGDIIIVDAGNYLVTRLSPTGHLLGQWASHRPETENAETQSGVATDALGNIYVSDAMNDRIRELSPAGQVLAEWGTKGSGPGQFDHPEELAIDRQGNLYVADVNNSRVQKLSASGQPLAQWGTEGTAPGQFHHPRGIALDSDGNVYVADTDNQRIQKLSPTGQPLARWGTEGVGPGQFRAPAGLAVDTKGHIFVADLNNHRIQEFSATGQPIAQWGGRGQAPGQFQWPTDVAIDARGNLYVTDTGNHRIQVANVGG